MTVKAWPRSHGSPPPWEAAGWVVRSLGSIIFRFIIVIRFTSAVLTAFLSLNSRHPCCPGRPAPGYRPRPHAPRLHLTPIRLLRVDSAPRCANAHKGHYSASPHSREGHLPLPTHGSHRLPEVTPPPPRARPQNHWFTTGPQAPRGTLFPPGDTVAHRASGSHSVPPPSSSTQQQTIGTNSPSGGFSGVALARRPPSSLCHAPAPLLHHPPPTPADSCPAAPTAARSHCLRVYHRRAAAPSLQPVLSRRRPAPPAPSAPHAVSRTPPSSRPGAPSGKCPSTPPPRSPPRACDPSQQSPRPPTGAPAAWHLTIEATPPP